MKNTFILKRRHLYPVIFLGLCCALIALVFWLIQWNWVPKDKQFEAVIAALGAAAGFTHFLYSQYLEQTKLFHELSREFNQRYDRLNGQLNSIREAKCIAYDKRADFEKNDINCLYDYFNLCGEEYLYFHAGHIDPHVWVSWCVGMSDFAKIEVIKVEWEKELKRPSYYGFDLKEVTETAEKAMKAHEKGQHKTMGGHVEAQGGKRPDRSSIFRSTRRARQERQFAKQTT